MWCVGKVPDAVSVESLCFTDVHFGVLQCYVCKLKLLCRIKWANADVGILVLK